MRLRCKVIEKDGKTYLVAMAVFVDGKLRAHAMSEEETVTLEMTMEEWNALEFHWFEDKGPAPHKQHKWPPR